MASIVGMAEARAFADAVNAWLGVPESQTRRATRRSTVAVCRPVRCAWGMAYLRTWETLETIAAGVDELVAPSSDHDPGRFDSPVVSRDEAGRLRVA
jgi:hypothetical protein